MLGDKVIATRDITPRCPYYDFTVCPDSDQGSLEVNTRAVPNGSYRVALRVTDAANNELLIYGPNPIEVANPAGDGRSGPESGRLVRLAARFADSSRSTLTVPYGRRVRVRGRLSEIGNRGIGRAQVDVFERTARSGARERLVGSVRTRDNGDFSYVLKSGDPSRAVRLAYRSNVPATLASRTLRLRVRAASSLKASLRGTVVRFGGRVLSGPLPKSGKRVLLQGKAPGYTWATFATTRSNRSGRFSGRYRLPIRRPGVRLQIRVVVPGERAYPYASYSGRPISLRVR